MEIRVNVLGKVAYIQGESRDNKAKAELYPSGEGVYAVMDGDDFVCLRVVSSKIHDDTKGDYYACVEENWTHAKIANFYKRYRARRKIEGLYRQAFR